MHKAQVPFWFTVRNPGKCKCGAELQRGDAALYDIGAQTYLECAKCSTPPTRAAVTSPTITPAPAATVTPAPAAGNPLAAVVAGIEEFARRNGADESGVKRITDTTLAAMVRAAATES